MSRPARITIDLSALQHNFIQVKKMAPHSFIMAMVKSNAYGHGIVRMAKALKEADAFGVACEEEGLLLRHAGITQPIILMEGLFSSDEINIAVDNQFTIVIHHPMQIDMLEKTKIIAPLSVWIKIDTGMHRLGFQPDDIKKVYARLLQCQNVKKPLGWMTHFSDSDAINKKITQEQLNLFHAVTERLPGPRSLANSAGIMAWPESHADWVRPGIMLYGASPFENKKGRDHHLRPVMSFHSKLIAIHELKKGARVGYGGNWVCEKDQRIGVVGLGYGDGYPRHAKNGTPILVNDQQCELVGRVAMDMLTVDLHTQPNAQVGDPVLLWGEKLPVETIAQYSETNAYELLTRITQRVPSI